MPLSDADLTAIQQRNERRKELKAAASEGPWGYDSYGFVNQSERIPFNRRLGILIRPMTWFDSLGGRVDEGINKFSRKVFDQGYRDGEYIARSRDEQSERDIDTLLSEVLSLRAKSK